MYDVAIIGAGAAGLFASIGASQHNVSVLVLEKNKRPGIKLSMTGGGRCNVTSTLPIEELIAHIPGNGKFLYSCFSQFNNQDIMNFFTAHGVALKEEDHGRIFPVTNKAKTIVSCLEETAKKAGVDFHYQSAVTQIQKTAAGLWEIQSGDQIYQARHLILTTGGCTYRQTGSTGDGYRFAKSMGHHITPLYPTEAPLVSSASFIQERRLQGISLSEVELSVLNAAGKAVITHRHDLLITHFGLSGPCALRCSMFVNQELKTQDEVSLRLNLKSEWQAQDWKTFFTHSRAEQGDKQVKNAWKPLTQERVLVYLLEQAGISPQQTCKQITPEQYAAFYQAATAWKIPICRTWPLEKAFVTGGGINLKEVNPKTLESKCCEGLFFAGEILDINAYTGGFNLTVAFATGYVAGSHAGELASYYDLY